MEDLCACCRVVDTVVLLVMIPVEVMVLQEEVLPGEPCYVCVRIAPHPECLTEAASLEPLLDFQDHILVALNRAALLDDTLAILPEDEGIADYDGMLGQSDIMDASVVVPRIPVVGV